MMWHDSHHQEAQEAQDLARYPSIVRRTESVKERQIAKITAVIRQSQDRLLGIPAHQIHKGKGGLVRTDGTVDSTVT
jgi:hypothetical protein